MTGRVRLSAPLAALLLLAAAPAPDPPPAPPALGARQRGEPSLARLRSLYLAAVRDEGAIATGLAEVEALRASSGARPGTRLAATLTAYRGALVTLRAKHALWPTRKLQHMREGLALLDAVVAGQPELVEPRYLRLMSCYYLPRVLGRAGSVREDFAALARLLPAARDEYPPDLYAAVVRFVLEKGRLPAERRAPLEDALAAME